MKQNQSGLPPLEYLSVCRFEFLLVRVPQSRCPSHRSGLNPVHLCSYEAKEFLLRLNPPNDVQTLPTLHSSVFPTNTPPPSLSFPSFSSCSFSCLCLSFLFLSAGNSLCSAAQVWQWGVCGGRTSRTLRLLWWVALGDEALYLPQMSRSLAAIDGFYRDNYFMVNNI